MNEPRVIFWDGTKAIVYNKDIDIGELPPEHLEQPCVDEYGMRAYAVYGYYNRHRSWLHSEYYYLPQEFKVALMLLGHHEVK